MEFFVLEIYTKYELWVYYTFSNIHAYSGGQF